MEHSDSHSLSEQVWRIAVESSDDARCFARFRLIEQIGCGGSGAVWKAYDPELNRLVAVKIPRRILTTVSETEAFLREGRAAGKLNHRGIVTIHEVGLHDGVPFLVSSLIEGLSLREWYLRTNPGDSRIARICLLIAEALEYAHSSGVIHRDLKPDNIVIDAEDQPHILDFGLAKRELNDVTISIAGGVIGTPSYMSPEQAMGEGHFVDRRTDIYSLGVILFEMLTGQLPFSGDARMLLTKIICDDPPVPRTINPRVPKDLETVCLKCLEKSPAHRFPTAALVAADLNCFLDDVPITTRPVTRVERLSRWCRRNRMLAVLATSTFLFLLLTTIVSIGGYISTRNALSREFAARHESEKQYLANLNAREISSVREAARVFEFASAAANEGAPDTAMLWMTNALMLLPEKHPMERPIRMYLTSLNEVVHQLRGCRQVNDGTAIGIADHGRKCLIREPSEDNRSPDQLSGSIRMMDVDTGLKCAAVLKGIGPGDLLVLNADGTRIARFTAEEGQIRIENTETGLFEKSLSKTDADMVSPDSKLNVSGRGEPLRVTQMAFSPDSRMLAEGDSMGMITLWDIESESGIRQISESSADDNSAIRRTVNQICFSPDGSQLAAVDSDSRLKIFDAISGKLLGEVRTGSVSGNILYSKDGRRIFTCTVDGVLHSWNAATAELMSSTALSVQSPSFLQHNPDESLLLLTDLSGWVCVWDLRAGRMRGQKLQHNGKIHAAAFADQGKSVVVTGDEIRTWNVATQKDDAEFVPGSHLTSMALLPGQNTLLLGDEHGIHLWRTGADSWQESWSGVGPVDRMAVSPDGHFVLTATDRSVQLWDFKTRARHHSPIMHPDSVSIVVFLDDSGSFLTGCRDGYVRQYAVTTGTEVFPAFHHGSEICDLDIYVPKQILLTAGGSGRVNVWDLASHQRKDVEILRDTELTAVAARKNGKEILVGGRDMAAQHYSIVTGVPHEMTMHHSDAVLDVAVSPDNEIEATSTSSGLLRIWQHVVRASREYSSDSPLAQLCFSHDSDLLFARSSASIRVISVPQQLEGTPQELSRRISRMLGKELTPYETVRLLKMDELAEHR